MNLDEVARGCDELHDWSVDLVFKAWTGKVSHLVSSIAGCNIALKLDRSDVGSSTVLLRANSATVAQLLSTPFENHLINSTEFPVK